MEMIDDIEVTMMEGVVTVEKGLVELEDRIKRDPVTVRVLIEGNYETTAVLRLKEGSKSLYSGFEIETTEEFK